MRHIEWMDIVAFCEPMPAKPRLHRLHIHAQVFGKQGACMLLYTRGHKGSNRCDFITSYPCTSLRKAKGACMLLYKRGQERSNHCDSRGNIALLSTALTLHLLCLHRFHRLGGCGGCLLCSLLCHAVVRSSTLPAPQAPRPTACALGAPIR